MPGTTTSHSPRTTSPALSWAGAADPAPPGVVGQARMPHVRSSGSCKGSLQGGPGSGFQQGAATSTSVLNYLISLLEAALWRE